MTNPESFVHLETNFTDKGEFYILNMIYLGQNTFRESQKEYVKMKVSKETCEIIEFLEHQVFE